MSTPSYFPWQDGDTWTGRNPSVSAPARSPRPRTVPVQPLPDGRGSGRAETEPRPSEAVKKTNWHAKTQSRKEQRIGFLGGFAPLRAIVFAGSNLFTPSRGADLAAVGLRTDYGRGAWRSSPII
jgi:hypothetical protein